MKFINKIEELDTKEIVNSEYINWEYFRNKTVLVTGATGLIGKQIVKALLLANSKLETNINVIALARNPQKVKDIFGSTKNNKIKFIYQDIEKNLNYSKNVDDIIHTANSTSSSSFVETPVETISSIVQGTKNILNFAIKSKAKSVVYLSSMEVYGEIPLTREEPLSENDLGYIDILKPRSSYQEGKRTAECLCSAYAHEYKVPVKIARLAQTIGAGVDYDDNRVFAQFARNIVEKQDIVLKTKGETIRSYCYITDAVVAILSMLEKGENGESYNVANPKTTCSIKEMAQMLCEKYLSSKLVVNIDDRFFPSTTKYYLSTTKYYRESGWEPLIDIETSFSRLISSFIHQKTFFNKEHKKVCILKRIFSIRNINIEYKQCCILGFNFKIKRCLVFQKFVNMPIQKNKIVFANFRGSGYGCNPKYIAEEIIKRRLKYDLVWLINNNVDVKDMPKEIRLVKFSNKKALKELATAKIWVDNNRKAQHYKKGLRKKQGQIYIQTWHGSLGIKKIDADVKKFNTTKHIDWLENAKRETRDMDFFITNSNFEKDTVAKALWFYNETKNYGHPRNDIFFKDSKNVIEKVKEYYNLESSQKIFLYVPTFRDDWDLSWYTINYASIRKAISSKFGGDWVLMVRLHPNIAKKINFISKDNLDIIDATYYPDIQELLVSADIAMTDYSSCIFDFMLSRKPGFIYATDIKKYNTSRGFYFPLESTPFPVAVNNNELIENIENFDNEKYRREVEKFLEEKGCIEDGHASERVVDLIEEIMKG